MYLMSRKRLEGLRVPTSWAPQAACPGIRNPSKPFMRQKVDYHFCNGRKTEEGMKFECVLDLTLWNQLSAPANR